MSHWTVYVNMTFYGQLCQNVLHFENRSDPFSNEQVATEIRDNWIEQVRGRLPFDVSFNSVAVYDTENSSVAPYNLVFQKNGAQSGDNQLVPFACWVFQLKTATGGPSGHGRFYLPGVLKGFHAGGILQNGGVTVWEPFRAALVARYCLGGNGPLELKVFTRRPNFIWKPVTNIVLRNTMGAQRNRNIGVGS